MLRKEGARSHRMGKGIKEHGVRRSCLPCTGVRRTQPTQSGISIRTGCVLMDVVGMSCSQTAVGAQTHSSWKEVVLHPGVWAFVLVLSVLSICPVDLLQEYGLDAGRKIEVGLQSGHQRQGRKHNLQVQAACITRGSTP